MKAVIKSVSPRICEKVASGDCTILVSKTAPKCREPFKCYIYATKAKKWFRSGIILTSNELLWLSNGNIKMCDGFELWADGEDHQCVNSKVIGEFICDKIIEWQYDRGHQYYVEYPDDCTSYFPYLKCHSEATGLRCSEIEELGKGKPLYGWHISNLEIYDKPKELGEFKTPPCEKSEKACGKCKWLVKINTPDVYECECYVEDGRLITRPPQSWQYAEEL